MILLRTSVTSWIGLTECRIHPGCGCLRSWARNPVSPLRAMPCLVPKAVKRNRARPRRRFLLHLTHNLLAITSAPTALPATSTADRHQLMIRPPKAGRKSRSYLLYRHPCPHPPPFGSTNSSNNASKRPSGLPTDNRHRHRTRPRSTRPPSIHPRNTNSQTRRSTTRASAVVMYPLGQRVASRSRSRTPHNTTIAVTQRPRHRRQRPLRLRPPLRYAVLLPLRAIGI